MIHLILSTLLVTSLGGTEPVNVEAGIEPAPAVITLKSILVFSRTSGFRHGSIGPGKAALTALGKAHGFRVQLTEDPTLFNNAELEKHQVVVFLNTTQDVLDSAQEQIFEQWIRAGGGYVGIHSASDTEYDWAFYGHLVGAYFSGHPRVQEATVNVVYPKHPAMMHLPRSWQRTDEWYNFKKLPENVRILAWLDTDSYEGSTMKGKHPAAWCHMIDKGRSLYTVGGHTNESFAEPLFMKHLHGAIWWACGNNNAPPSLPADDVGSAEKKPPASSSTGDSR